MKKWIIGKHTSEFNTMLRVLELLESHDFNIDSDKKMAMRKSLESEGLYKPRKGTDTKSLSTVESKISSLKFWMFGYSGKSADNRFYLSSTAQKILNEKNVSMKRDLIIELAASVQFPHYHGRTDKSFEIYPIRLIFKLLLDARLNKKLYAIEYAQIVCKVCSVNDEAYEKIVQEIIKLRNTNQNSVNFSEEEGLAAYEFSYLAKLFTGIDYFTTVTGKKIATFTHKKNENNVSGATTRIIKDTYVRICDGKIKNIASILDRYRFDEKPKRITAANVGEVYNSI